MHTGCQVLVGQPLIPSQEDCALKNIRFKGTAKNIVCQSFKRSSNKFTKSMGLRVENVRFNGKPLCARILFDGALEEIQINSPSQGDWAWKNIRFKGAAKNIVCQNFI